MTGKLISFEGIDGCGKGTQISLLKGYLQQNNRPYTVHREPGGTDISERIRSLLLHETEDMSLKTELLLFSAARAQLMYESIIPKLDNGEVVILDRFYDSTFAYQGRGRGLDLEDITAATNIATDGVQPDATFYLQLSVDEALARTAGQEKDRMESAGYDFFTRVKNGYDYLAETQPHRIQVINAVGDPKDIHRDIVHRIEELYLDSLST